MPTGGTYKNTRHDPGEREIIELHWMKEPDLAMHQAHGIAAPALCGIWMEPDEPPSDPLVDAAPNVEYATCWACELLHALNQDTR